MGSNSKATPRPFDLDREIFERQRGESQQAWEAWVNYRDMEKRSLRALAKTLSKSDSLMVRWSTIWRWQERTVEWDNHLDKVYRDTRTKAQKKMAENHAKLGQAIQVKVAQRLNNLNPDDIEPGQISKLVDVAVKIERLAMGAPTEHTKAEIEGQVTIQHDYSIANKIITDSQARELALQLMARLYLVEPDPSSPGNPRDTGGVEIL